MSYYDLKNMTNRSKSRSFYNENLTKSARSRSTFNMSNLTDFRRTKSSVPQRDGQSETISKDDQFSAQFQRQILTKKSFLSDKSDRQVAPTLIVRRKPDEKLKNPDRISLDHQNLTNCPILENEDNLRLLNYQYNFIQQIQHLENLKKLILLDLYDNRIERISGLENLRSLRVLMLGRNRIAQLDEGAGLTHLTKLDVLDLHGNCLVELGRALIHLGELRVLNIAGNCLRSLEHQSLVGLHSLIELNARRNCIEQVRDVTSATCASLQRLYLSHNQLMKLTDITCLVNLSSLNELSIDNNPLCRHNNIRASIIYNFPQLEQLDLKPITDEEKYRAKQIVNRLELVKPNSQLSRHLAINCSNSNNSSNTLLANNGSAKSVNFQKFHSLKDRRKVPTTVGLSNNNNIATTKENVTKRVLIQQSETTPQSPTSVTNSTSSNTLTHAKSEALLDSTGESTNAEHEHNDLFARSIKFATYAQESFSIIKPSEDSSNNLKRSLILRPSSTSTSNLSRSSISGDSTGKFMTSNIKKTMSHDTLISAQSDRKLLDYPEISAASDELKFTSNESMKCLDDKEFWMTRLNWSNSICSLIFCDIEFNDIARYFPTIKSRFPNLKKLSFTNCNIHSFLQINTLASLRKLDELIIDADTNAIGTFKLLKNYVIFRLNHLGLKRFQNQEISTSAPHIEQASARRLFLSFVTLGHSMVTQLHMIDLISDIRRRELLLASQEPPPLIVSSTTAATNGNNTGPVSLDIVGKFGLLITHPDNDNSLSNLTSPTLNSNCQHLIETVLSSVQAQTAMEANFHQQWFSSISSILTKRLIYSGLTNRHSRTKYMQSQYHKVLQSGASSLQTNRNRK